MSDRPASSRPPLLLLVAFLAGGLALAWRASGVEPELWADTLFDQQLVRACNDLGVCDLRGLPASVGDAGAEPLRLGAAWHALRVFLDAAGLPVQAVFLLMLALDAVAFALVFLAGWAAAGPVAGFLAPLLLAGILRSLPLEAGALYANRTLPVLGAALAALLVATVRRNRLLPAAAAGVAVGMAAGIHGPGGLVGGALLTLGGRPDGGRLPSRGLAVAAAVAALLGTAPWMWWTDVSVLLQGWSPGTRPPVTGETGFGGAPVGWALAGALLPVVAALASPRGSVHRRLGAAWVLGIAPAVAVYVGVVASGKVPAAAKYLITPMPLVAVALAWAAARILGEATERLARRSRFPGRLPVPRWGIPAAGLVAAGILGAGMDPHPRPAAGGPGAPDAWRFADAHALAPRLDAAGWTVEGAARGLASPAGRNLVFALAVDTALPAGEGVRDGRRAVVVQIARAGLPVPLPDGWEVLREDGAVATVLAWAAAVLDWEGLRLCGSGPGGPACVPAWEEVVARDLASLVPTGPGLVRGPGDRLEARVPLRPSGTDAMAVWIPPSTRGCGWRIASAGEGPAESGEGGTAARLEAGAGEGGTWARLAAGAGRGELILVRDAGIPSWIDCPVDDLPPFVIDGREDEVRRLRTALEAGRGAP